MDGIERSKQANIYIEIGLYLLCKMLIYREDYLTVGITMNTFLKSSLIVSAMALPLTVQADLTKDIQDQINANQAAVQKSLGVISENLTALFAHRGMAPADTLGGGIGGFELALDTTFTDFDADEMKTIAGSDTDFDFDTVALPKLSASVGLPALPLDLGITYLPEVGGFSYVGAHAKYSIIEGGIAMPAVSAAATYSKASLEDAIDVTTYGIETSISKGFGVGVKFVPYAGLGYVSGTTELNEDAIPGGVTNFKTEYESSGMKLFAGASFQMGIMNIVGQWDQIGDYNSYNAKIGFRF